MNFNNVTNLKRALIVPVISGMLMGTITSCGNSGKGEDLITATYEESTDISEQSTDDTTTQPTENATDQPTDDTTDQATELPPEQDDNSDETEELTFSSIYELFENTDENWNESEEYLSAVKAYDAEYENIIARGEKDYWEGLRPHFAVAYIDEDDIPELLVSYECTHITGVSVYTCDVSETEAEVQYIGAFSSYGQMSYSEKHNVIMSSYGNNGYFMSVYSAIQDGKAVFLDAKIANNGLSGGEDGLYYHGFGVPDWYDGTREAIDKYSDYDEIATLGDEDDHIVSEDEYRSVMDSIVNPNNEDCVIYVNYNNLYREETGKGTMYSIQSTKDE